MTNPRVFISYAHESAEHRAAVKSLADWLTEHDVETLTDHPYENRAPEIGWPAWMLHSVEDSDVVLVICTARLKARYEMREELSAGLGATYEGAIVTQLMYNAAQRNTKFFPVLPDRGDRNNIPLELQRFDSGHQFPSGNERILRLITEEVELPKPSRAFQTYLPGQLRGPKDNRLAPQGGRVYGRESEVLRILDFLRSADDSAVVCAHVTGSGGIGKTEVCKAALKCWLTEAPERRAFYIDLPDTAGADGLIYRIARALGAQNVASFEDLRPLLRHGLYYLDNLEGVAEKREGQNVLRQLREQPGVRLLASSRVELPRELGKPIRIDALPPDAALELFRDVWTGAELREDNGVLQRFVAENLGNHALSITLVAQLGDSYAFSDLVRKWTEKGTVLAADALQGDTRRSSLAVSLALTAESLRPHPGALVLWTLGAFFATGIDEQSLAAFERAVALPDSVRQRLSRHHVWMLRDSRFRILPPIARYALDEAANERGGFSWNETRPYGFGYFLDLASRADSVASTDESLIARGQLLDRFGAIARMLEFESGLPRPRRDLLDQMDDLLFNVYNSRVAQARELLLTLQRHLSHRAGAVLRLGDLEKRLGRPEEARRLYGEALELYKREPAGLGQANTLSSLGDLEQHLGRLEEARRLYGEALELYQRQPGGSGQANTLQSLGEMEHRLGRLEEARRLFGEALELFKLDQRGLGQAGALVSLGHLEQRLGRPEEARRLYGEALELFKREHSGVGQANTLQSLGDLEQRLGRLEEARQLYGEVLELFELEQAELQQAITLKSLGDLERRLGRLEDARRLYGEALELFKREHNGLGQANTLKSLGDLEQRLGRLDEARRLYGEALELFRREQSGLGEAYALESLGDLERHLGRLEEARRLYGEALELFKRQQSGLGQANTLRSLGDLQQRLRRVDEARRLYGEALELFRREQNGLGQANTLSSLGDLEQYLDRLEEARRLYGEAFELYRREQVGLGQANTLKSLGDLEGRLGRPEEARRLYGEALELFRREQDGLGQASTLKSLGDLEQSLERPEEARRLYGEALDLFQREQSGAGQANTLQSLGHLDRGLENTVEALRQYDEALSLYIDEQDPGGTASTWAEIARCHHTLGDDNARDNALINALVASQEIGFETVQRYVTTVLIELTGTEDVVAWIESHASDIVNPPTS